MNFEYLVMATFQENRYYLTHTHIIWLHVHTIRRFFFW